MKDEEKREAAVSLFARGPFVALFREALIPMVSLLAVTLGGCTEAETLDHRIRRCIQDVRTHVHDAEKARQDCENAAHRQRAGTSGQTNR